MEPWIRSIHRICSETRQSTTCLCSQSEVLQRTDGSEIPCTRIPTNTTQMTGPQQEFVVYSKDGCPYCDKVVQLLEFAELKHVVYKLGQNFTKEAFHDEYGRGATFPQVTYNDKRIGGCSDTIKFLREQKHLELD